MAIDSGEALGYTVAFILPGFIISWGIAVFIPQRRQPAQLLFLRFITFSLLNLVMWSKYINLLVQDKSFPMNVVRAPLLPFAILILTPAVIGLIVGHGAKKGWMRAALHRLGCNPIHEIPTAWDYKFSRPDSVRVLVTLKNGEKVAGVFGSDSFASDVPEERDLYIEDVCEIEEDGEWRRPPKPSSILIPGHQIKHIQFWKT